MQSVNRVVDALASGGTAGARATALVELEGLLEDCTAAIQVWQEYLDAPGAPGDRWTIVSWVGPQRVKRLHEINLVARERILRMAEAAGPAVKRSVTMPDDLIEMGYRQLRDGETGTDAATKAITIMKERMQQVRGLIERLRSAPAPKPQKAPLKKAGASKGSAAPAPKARPAPAKGAIKPARKPSLRVVKKASAKSALKRAVAKLVKKAVKKKRR